MASNNEESKLPKVDEAEAEKKWCWLKFFSEAGIDPNATRRYQISFQDHRVRPGLLKGMDQDNLKRLGVIPTGDRKTIMEAIKDLIWPPFEKVKEDAKPQTQDGQPRAAPVVVLDLAKNKYFQEYFKFVKD